MLDFLPTGKGNTCFMTSLYFWCCLVSLPPLGREHAGGWQCLSGAAGRVTLGSAPLLCCWEEMRGCRLLSLWGLELIPQAGAKPGSGSWCRERQGKEPPVGGVAGASLWCSYVPASRGVAHRSSAFGPAAASRVDTQPGTCRCCLRDHCWELPSTTLDLFGAQNLMGFIHKPGWAGPCVLESVLGWRSGRSSGG